MVGGAVSSRCSPCCGCGDTPAPPDDTKPPVGCCKGPVKGPAKGFAKVLAKGPTKVQAKVQCLGQSEEPEDDPEEEAPTDVIADDKGCAVSLHVAVSGGAAPLHDIEEEDNEEESSSSTLRNIIRHRGSTPSPTFSQHSKSRSKKKARTRSVTSSTSTETSTSSAPAPAPAKMQAEQGSIGDLKTYHNRYLRSRRHTLANVR